MAIINFNSISGVSTISATTSVTVGSGNSTVTLTGSEIVGVSSITVGNSFIKNNAVGLGTTSTEGRNAGINTVDGTIILNKTTEAIECYTNGRWNTVSTLDDTTNYFGNETDGSYDSSGNTTLTVTNKNGSFDGDMLVKQYSSFTVNSGHTYTVDQPCRGLVILCTGNVTIDGTLSMAGKGAFADAEDNSTNPNSNIPSNVPSNGLIWRFVQPTGGQGPFSTSPTDLNGAAPPASVLYTWLNTHNSYISNPSFKGYEVRMSRQGASGGSSVIGNGSGPDPGNPGTAGTNSESSGLYTMQTGGGGSGSNGDWTGSTGSGAGSYGSCFGGGSGGGGNRSNNPLDAGMNAGVWGGAGGFGDNGGAFNYCGGGGAGNPGGAGNANAGTANPGGNGTGGLLVIIAKGSVTVAGTIDVRGVAGGSASGHPDSNRVESAGGGSGGGIILIAYGGTYLNTGTVTAAGGAGGTSSPSGYSAVSAGAGGAGSVRTLPISAGA